MADDAYEVVKGSLKLKGVADGGIKKKKKKKKNKALEEAAKQAMVPETRNSSGEDQEIEKEENDNRTAAQKSFDQIQEKRAAERILKKAGKTHRQRVEKFNEYLDELTEHYDIPKVSWTK
ncbi:protein FAM32A [Exaiptasia diaphana]|uniref:Protein FAM32A n=1 Tax=Exaiptasia diaphana TaxID=2652724 RepID=A0A913XWV3_EXADI|nr:protein FAM32A [Exaiptasia diaphana]XP_020913606.1 protein FAM32A [Exaiptasia diaphana]KXJ06018.1 Protein FAM32A [Exaiptasia diaphana]KXJ08357.1 Protein FAM32A [Exaiptasia diaphana]